MQVTIYTEAAKATVDFLRMPRGQAGYIYIVYGDQ